MLDSFRSPKPHLKNCVVNPFEITMTIESPPLVCYGTPKESTGALLSGLIHLNVQETEQKFENFTLALNAEVLTHKPVTAHCKDCMTNLSELHKWNLISEPVILKKGVHTYPFSYLLPGHLPASNNNALSKISYNLSALALSAKGGEVKFKHHITLQRAILPGNDRHSVRIFPPTNLCASVKLPSVVHPGGDLPLEIRLDGVVPKKKQNRWRLRKISWRIDESTSVVSPACKHHSNKLGGDGKGMLHENVRTVGSGEIKSGWKSDFESPGGKIEMEFMAGIPVHAEAAPDIDSPCGITVSHDLIIELIVVEEHVSHPAFNSLLKNLYLSMLQCPTTQTRLITPTGAARVLRMKFRLVCTDRSGLGISWDEEAPPIYEDVPAAPPTYFTIEAGSIAEWLPPVYVE